MDHLTVRLAPQKETLMSDGNDTVMKAFADLLLEATGEKKKKPNWENIDTEVTREGKKIILPNDPGPMEYDAAIAALERKKEDENRLFDTHEFIEGYPLDAAVALIKAMKELYGWASPVPTPGFFGPRPPRMLTVKVGHKANDVIQIPWGSFSVPGIEKNIQIDSHRLPNGMPVLVVIGKVRKREEFIILSLVQKAREILARESIYRGKAISLVVDTNGSLDMNTAPSFMDVDNVKETDLILNDDVRAQVEVSLLTPMKKTELCRQHRIPLKRGVLLSGPYGTGKTMTARTAAKVAQDNGWTFIMLNRVQGLEEALRFAEQYAPAMVFAEDIDRIVEERDENANDLVNTIDGILSKTSEVITCLTTNHVEKIAQVMLRPGRLDAVITVNPPNAKTCERLVRLYSRNLIDENEDLTAVGERLSGQIPATIREIVERSKLGMISREDSRLNASDLLIAAEGMDDHLRLLNRVVESPSAAERLAQALAEVLGTPNPENFREGLEESVEDINRTTGSYSDDVQSVVARNAGEIRGAIGDMEERLVRLINGQAKKKTAA